MNSIRFRLPVLIAVLLTIFAGYLANPGRVSADVMQLKWHQMDTPGSVPGKNDIVRPVEVNDLAIGSDGLTFYAVDTPWANTASGEKALYKSIDGGISWDDSAGKYLYTSMSAAERANFRVWSVAVAPDDASVLEAVTSDAAGPFPRKVWGSRDGGTTWSDSRCPATDNISAIAISQSNAGRRNTAIGTRTGNGTGNIWLADTGDSYNWQIQDLPGDILSLKFSPNYSQDDTVICIFSDMNSTCITAGIYDSIANATDWSEIYQFPIEITSYASGNSPIASQIISADLSLPSTYSGLNPSARKYFISMDSPPSLAAGIFRIDDTAVYQLMAATPSKRISSLAYFGTSSSGKLLAGEVYGNICSASVMTWFTDDPFRCSVPCWYSSINPPTGGAAADNLTVVSYGNASVAWSPDGENAYAGTASTGNLTGGINWPNPYLVGRACDESAFSRSPNNGRTWASLSLIDTLISNLTDIAPAPDCSGIFLATVNKNAGFYGFDSAWRSRSLPTGQVWERTLCALTNGDNCTAPQTDIAFLRMAGDTPEGKSISWTAQNTDAVRYSFDYGDSWSSIGTDYLIQDAAFEDSQSLYLLNSIGQVQRFSYSGKGWIAQRSALCGLERAYSISTAYTGLTPDNDKGIVIVGGTGAGAYDVAYSLDYGKQFKQVPRTLPMRNNTMVVAAYNFTTNGNLYAINSSGMYYYSIYTANSDPWSISAGGPDSPRAITGLAISRNGSSYYGRATATSSTPYIRGATALAGYNTSIRMGATNMPTTRFRACGGMELDQPVTVYAIDQRNYNPPTGGIWYYIDDLLWTGPLPTGPVDYFKVGCDPATGRVGAVEMQWTPRSLSRGYNICIAKDIDFYMPVVNIGSSSPYYTPADLDHPSLYIPPGGGVITDKNGNKWTIPALEAGRTYYWKIRVQDVMTNDNIKSPWSWRESFTGMPGYRVTSPYLSPVLLSPANGCKGCWRNPAFSWSPYQKAAGYEFILASDTDMTKIIDHKFTSTTACEYNGRLEIDTPYFWRVRAVDEDKAPFSDWSSTFSFGMEQGNAPDEKATAGTSTPPWVWVVISAGITMILITIVMLLKTGIQVRNE